MPDPSDVPDYRAVLALEEARTAIALAIDPVVETESVVLTEALGRVLARDLVTMVDVPAHDNAAMDGYAFAWRKDAANLRVVGRALAGGPHAGRVEAGECVRIMTGAVMPAGCDTVVPIEDVEIDGEQIVLPSSIRPGQHCRLAGEDLDRGAVAMTRGRVLRPADIGLAASIGLTRLEVVRRLRVAVFSTGSELREPDRPLDGGGVRDSNRPTLVAMLTRLGVEAIDLGIVHDDRDALADTLARACDPAVAADVIVTSGGVSAGDADHLRDVIDRMGSVVFWKLAIKPGRPMAFGRIAAHGRSALLFGLPGNPVATMVVFHALVRDALMRAMGATVAPLPMLSLISDVALPKLPGRTEFVRGIAHRQPDGWHVRPARGQGSGTLRSMSEANCLVVLPHAGGPVAAGDVVEAWAFEGLS